MKVKSLLVILLCASAFGQTLKSHVESVTRALTGSAIAGPRVDLTCTPPASGPVPDKYNFYRSTVSGSGFVIVGTNATCAYSDSTVTFATTYFYVATSVNTSTCPTGQVCESANSNQVSAVVGTNPIPNPPQALTVGTIVAGVHLKWTPPVAAAGTILVSYSVWRGGSSTLLSPTKIATVKIASYVDLTPLKGTHYYEVKANDTVNGVAKVSKASNIVKVIV